MLLFPVFSTIASAESVDIPPYTILQSNKIFSNNEENEVFIDSIYFFEPNDGVIGKREVKTQITSPPMSWYTTRNTGYYLTTFVLRYNDDSVILQKDREYSVSLNNIYHSLLWEFQGYSRYIRAPKIEAIILHATDGTLIDTSHKSITHKYGEPVVNVSFKHTPTKDIQYIEIQIKSTFRDCLNDLFDLSNGYPYYTFYFGEYNGDDKYQFSLEVTSEEVGILNGISSIITTIKDKISNLYNSVVSGFTNVVNSLSQGFTNLGTKLSNLISSILELPKKIWDKIYNGLIELFVPSGEDMVDYRELWEQLLYEKFGALYEVGGIIESIINSITTQTSTVADSGYITIPKVSLNSYGIPFSFGGYEVDIRPDGFEFLITICKRVISISCTLVFMNALRKRYERVIGG